jgi:hypothetical protein
MCGGAPEKAEARMDDVRDLGPLGSSAESLSSSSSLPAASLRSPRAVGNSSSARGAPLAAA